MSQKVKFKISRFNPEKDKKPYFKEYEIAVHPWDTVLDALISIRNDIDSSLSFRQSCKAGICGSCAIRINGRAKLACKSSALDEVSKFGEIKIEPLGNVPVLKDLVVDMKTFYDEMKGISPWIEAKKNSGKFEAENRITPEDADKIEKSSECIWCGACFSDCPSREVNNKYLGPAASVISYRYIFDVRDDNKKERLKKLLDKQIWACAHCERSTENCPMDIEPQEIISRLRAESIKEGLINNDGARHTRTVEKSVKKYGELSEAWLPVGTFGIFRVLKEIPVALKLFLKGKLPPFFMKKIQNHEEISQLEKNVKRNQNEKQKKRNKQRDNLNNL